MKNLNIKHFNQGDIIYYGKPFVFVLLNDQRLSRCDNCFNKLRDGQFITCDQCHYVQYCCQECQIESFQIHHVECNIIGQRPLRLLTRMIIRVLIKLMNYDNRNDFIYGFDRTWDCLMDHYDDIIHDSDIMYSFNEIYNELELLRSFNDQFIEQVTIEQLISIYGKILINSFALTDPNSGRTIGRVLYLGASIFDHSCQPDLYFQFHGLNIYFITLKDLDLNVTANAISYDDTNLNVKNINQLSICYLDEILPVWERKKLLKSSYYFDCNCIRCQNEQNCKITLMINNDDKFAMRMSKYSEMIDDYFHSYFAYELIDFIVQSINDNNNIPIDILQRKYIKDKNLFEIQQQIERLMKQYQQNLQESRQQLSSMNYDDEEYFLRINDFILCNDFNIENDSDYNQLSNEFNNLLLKYTKYYGNYNHPKILQRAWFWLGILLLKKLMFRKLLKNNGDQSFRITDSKTSTLLYRRIKSIQSFLRLKC